MSRTLRRPMFRMGGSTNEGITSGLDTPKRGLVDGPGKYSQPEPMKLDYNISQMFPTQEEMAKARTMYKPYFERPEGEGLSRFLINFGLNLASTPPVGKGFSGLISTAAGAAKEPTAQLFEDLDREKLQKNVADADLFKSIMEQKGNILSEAAGSDQSADVFKDQALMGELAKVIPQISDTLAKLQEDPNNQELKDKLQILEGQKKIILGKDPIAEASLDIFVKSPQGATEFSTERKKLLAANPDKYMTESGVNEVLLTQDTMKIIQQIIWMGKQIPWPMRMMKVTAIILIVIMFPVMSLLILMLLPPILIHRSPWRAFSDTPSPRGGCSESPKPTPGPPHVP